MKRARMRQPAPKDKHVLKASILKAYRQWTHSCFEKMMFGSGTEVPWHRNAKTLALQTWIRLDNMWAEYHAKPGSMSCLIDHYSKPLHSSRPSIRTTPAPPTTTTQSINSIWYAHTSILCCNIHRGEWLGACLTRECAPCFQDWGLESNSRSETNTE